MVVCCSGRKAASAAFRFFPDVVVEAARKRRGEKIHVRILMVVIQYSEIKTKGIRKIRD